MILRIYFVKKVYQKFKLKNEGIGEYGVYFYEW